MIQAIGLMIGCYIITRCFEMTRGKCGFLVLISATITFLVCLGGMAVLMATGLSLATLPAGLH